MHGTALRDEPAPAAARSRWFDKGAGTDLDRLPLLADAMEEVARALTEGLGGLAASPGEVWFKGIQAGKVETLLERRGRTAIFAIAQAPAWNTSVALHFDQAFVSTVVEALFGGAGEDAQVPQRDGLSPVESRIAHVIAEQTAEAMSTGFAAILPTRFGLEPIRPKPDPSLLGKPAVPVLIATLVLQTVGRPVELDIVIPRAALDPFSDRLACEPEAPDPEWSERLETEVGRATMRLQASIDLPAMSLRDLAGLEAGDVLTLPAGAKTNVGLHCAGGGLFRCELGQSSGHYTVRIEEPITDTGSSPRKNS